jgi:hypothetical protein
MAPSLAKRQLRLDLRPPRTLVTHSPAQRQILCRQNPCDR